MTTPELQSLVGTSLPGNLRLLELVREDDSLALFRAMREPDSSPCTLRVSLALQIQSSDLPLVESVIGRLSKYCVGVRGLAPPLAAGFVAVAGQPRLFVAHRGDADPTAADRIDAASAMSLDELKRILAPLAEALGALHDQGLVHGAVVPSAIHLAASGPTLSAFGLSEIASVLGGPAAARDVLPRRDRAPEQVAIVPATPSAATDTYGLALIASRLLAGKQFPAAAESDEISRAIDHPMIRPTPRTLGVDVPDTLDAVFASGLAAQPRERPADTRRWVAALATPPPLSTAAAPAPLPEAGHPADLAPPPPAPVAEQKPPDAIPDVGSAPRAERPRSFFEPATTAKPPPASGAWIVYLLIGLGVLLLFGGAGAGFYLAMTAPPPPPTATAVPTAPPPPTVPPRITVPGPTDPLPDAASPADSDDDGDPEKDAAAAATPLWQQAPDSGVTVLWPDDATALIPIGDHTPVIGTRDALVTILLFADLRCPHTRTARRSIERLVEEHGASVRIAVRLLPMPDNPSSGRAAQLAAATSLVSGPYAFWHLFELVSEDKTCAPDCDLIMLSHAQTVGAANASLDKALKDAKTQALLDDDRALAGRLMVHATPTWFINGRRLNGTVPWRQLESEVGREIVAAKGALAGGTPQARLYASRVTFNVTAAGADREQPEP